MSFLVTGANKGIGFQIVKALLKHPSTTTVFLGSRDLGRGEKARENLGPELAERCVVVQLDVSDKASIGKAAEAVKQQLESSDGAKLQGLINNAGVVGDGFGWYACSCARNLRSMSTNSCVCLRVVVVVVVVVV